MKKTTISILVITIFLAAVLPCYAAPNGGNPSTVTVEMTTADFWKEKTITDADEVLLTTAEIAAYNAAVMADSANTWVRDLENMAPQYDATKLTASLIADAATPATQYYIDGKAIDNDAYYEVIRKSIERTGYKGTREIQYAVASTHADIKSIPTREMLMDSLTDTADEIQLSSLLVNEPFVIKQKCQREDTTFYWGYSQNVSGWVDGANLAICKDREEWLKAWKINDINDKNFIVVTEDKIYLDQSTDRDYPAGLYLGLGTILKLVEPGNIPTIVGERGTWSNYVVYIPARNADGTYVRKMGLIAAHYNVSEGYLPYTQANILDLAFTCQGNRYGWGNMMGNTDCSGYVRNILRCFGFNFPRNTTTQRRIAGTDTNLRGFKNSELSAFLKTIPAGSLLYINGHAMIYIGTNDDIPYVISSAAMLSDPQGDLNVVKYLSVLVTPLTVRRANGYTWLWSLQDAVILPHKENIADYAVTAYKEKGADDSNACISLTKDGKDLVYGIDFIVKNPEEEGFAGYATVIGTGNYTGLHQRTRINYYGCIYTYTDLPENGWYSEYAKFTIDNNLMAGTSEETFSPDQSLTKAQLTSVLYKVAGSSEISEETAAYDDVPAGVYYEKASRWAKETNIFMDFRIEAKIFNGEQNVSRKMLVAAIYQVMGNESVIEENLIASYSDLDGLSESERLAFNWAVANNYISGYTDGTMRPDKDLTRAEFTCILYHLKNQ